GQGRLAGHPSTLAEVFGRGLEEAVDQLARRRTGGLRIGRPNPAFLAYPVQGPEENNDRRGHRQRDDRLLRQHHGGLEEAWVGGLDGLEGHALSGADVRTLRVRRLLTRRVVVVRLERVFERRVGK